LAGIGGAGEEDNGRRTITGVSETCKYETRSSAPFLHRRILFSTPTVATSAALVYQAGIGYIRGTAEDVVEPTPFANLKSVVTNPDRAHDSFVSKVKREDINLIEDKTYTISTSADGTIRTHKWWKKLDMDITYNSGAIGASNTGWVSGNSPSGNLFVCDIFANRDGTESDDGVSVSSELNVYWRPRET